MKISYETVQKIQEMSTEDLYTLWALAELTPDLVDWLFVECVQYELENRICNRSESSSVCA